MHRDGWMLGSYILVDAGFFKDIVGHGLSCFEQGAGAPTLQLSCYNSRGLQFHCLLWMESRISWKIRIFADVATKFHIFSLFSQDLETLEIMKKTNRKDGLFQLTFQAKSLSFSDRWTMARRWSLMQSANMTSKLHEIATLRVAHPCVSFVSPARSVGFGSGLIT